MIKWKVPVHACLQGEKNPNFLNRLSNKLYLHRPKITITLPQLVLQCVQWKTSSVLRASIRQLGFISTIHIRIKIKCDVSSHVTGLLHHPHISSNVLFNRAGFLTFIYFTTRTTCFVSEVIKYVILMLFLLSGLLKDLRFGCLLPWGGLTVVWLSRTSSFWIMSEDFIMSEPEIWMCLLLCHIFNLRPSLKEQVCYSALKITVLIIQIYSDWTNIIHERKVSLIFLQFIQVACLLWTTTRWRTETLEFLLTDTLVSILKSGHLQREIWM